MNVQGSNLTFLTTCFTGPQNILLSHYFHANYTYGSHSRDLLKLEPCTCQKDAVHAQSALGQRQTHAEYTLGIRSMFVS